MSRLSLRARLVALVAAVVVFALAAGGVGTWLALREFLVDRLDTQLSQAAQRRVQVVDDQIRHGTRPIEILGEPRGPDRYEGRPPLADSVALVDANGTAVAATGSAVLRLDPADARALADDPGRPRTVDDTGGQQVRAVANLLSDGRFLVVGLPVSDVTSTLNQLLVLELAVGGTAVVAAVALGAYGVRTGLRPLERVSGTAREIAADLERHGRGLERRVPQTDPRTEVGQLAESVNTMLGAAQAAYAARVESEDRMRHFLADASHELRTPITSLRGYAELERLRTAAGTDDPASTRDALRRIEIEGDRMARLVDDLLLLARTDQGAPIARVPVPADEVVAEAVDRVRVAHPTRAFVVDADGAGAVLRGDAEAMLQVLGNLLRNAAVHTPGPRPVRLGARRQGDDVVFTVADEGPGMPPEQAAHAFDRFWRADTGRTRATGGTGLGLAIVEALVSAQGGVVSLTSDVAAGTTVTIRVPAA